MDHNSAVAGSPASRQKNCNACVQAKRRCDRRNAICSRCMKKKIDCVYGKTQTTINSQSRNESSVVVAPCMDSLQFDSSALGSGPSLDVDYFGVMNIDSQVDASTSESLSFSVMDAASNSDAPIDPFMWLLDGSITADKDQWLVPTNQGPMIDRPGSPIDEITQMAYQKMARFCDYVEPWQLYDPKTPLYYIINRVKRFTSEAAARNATPFMHRYLYKDHTPSCIVECFSVNVLYTNRTPTNMAMVMRALQRNVMELVGSETRHATVMPVEKLARTQALFLYLVIRLFDGDITLRAEGEKDIQLLQTWLNDLCKVRRNFGDLAGSGDSATNVQPPKEWERWIFAESVRRTIIMAYSIMAVYEMMKKAETADNQSPWAYTHRWTLSRHLWEADSSFSFRRMWKEKPHYIIHNYSFEDFLKNGCGDDVDEFAEILLSMYMGVDETKDFISHQAAMT